MNQKGKKTMIPNFPEIPPPKNTRKDVWHLDRGITINWNWPFIEDSYLTIEQLYSRMQVLILAVALRFS